MPSPSVPAPLVPPPLDPPSLVLASGSPRRADLLRMIGARFEVRPTEVDESVRAGEGAGAYVERVGRAKATAGAGRRPEAVVVAADTAVVMDGEVLGKPADDDEAATMLRRLSGRDHEVLTGVVVVSGNRVVARVVLTRVWFRPLTDDDIAWYVATGEPADKAGAYGIQGAGGLFVERIDGNPQNVIGLPLADLADLCAEVGHPLRGTFG